MEIDSICGCKIPLTTEDLDKQMETNGEWLKTKMMEHILREHRDSQKPLTSIELTKLSEELSRL